MSHTSVLFILLFCTTFSQTLDQEDLSDKILENSFHLPEFSWIDPLSIQVTFPGHGKDTINLRAAGRVADTLVRCLFNGNFENDIWGSAVVSGCIDDSSVFLTIYSTHLPGKTSFVWSQAGVTNVVNPYAVSGNETENIDDYEFNDAEKRVKRGTYDDEYYEDEYMEEYYEEEYNDDSFDGPPPTPPSDLILSVKLGYEESLLQQMNGNHSTAQAYTVEVATHGSIHMRHSSLGTRIHLQFIGPPHFLSGKTLKVDKRNLKQVQLAKNDSTPLIVFVKTDDTNATTMGVAWPGYKGGACDADNSAAIVKWRSNPLKAAISFSHENGHLTGQLHDGREDEKNRGKTACEGTGIMSQGDALKDRPVQWSECSTRRFKKWYPRKGQCLETAPSCDSGESFSTPCTCGTGDDSMVCLSTHAYCWKKYFGDAPYQCLGSKDLEKALATPQRGDLAHDDDNLSLPLVVERILLKQAQQEKLIASLISQQDLESKSAEEPSNKINSKRMINPSIEERIISQGKLIQNQEVMMDKQEKLIQNLINQLDMVKNSTDVLSKEINSEDVISPSLEERLKNNEKVTENHEKLVENLLSLLDMERNSTEERFKNQENIIENLINQCDMEGSGEEVSSNEINSQNVINPLIEERFRNQENLIENLIDQLDMERNGTEVSPNNIDEKSMINPAVEERLSHLEKLNVFRTCDELEQSGVKTSGYYHLDPDGIQIGHPPIKAYCNFESHVTEILHNNEDSEITIPHCDSNFCHTQEYSYNAHMDQITALMELSTFCDQTIEFGCNGAPLSQGDHQFGAWVDRHGEDQVYFHGANHGRHTCSCDSTNTCSGSKYLHNTCNCDNTGARNWMKDSGKLTNVTALPVMSFKYGPFMFPEQQAKIKVGRLRCGGRKDVGSVPHSCKDLKLLGETRPGLYNLQDAQHDNYPKMSFCQLDQPGYGEDLELESHWVKRSSGPGQVFFAVKHSGSNDISDGTFITFDVTVANEGQGMNPSSGVFTAPVDGVYDFKLSGLTAESGVNYVYVYLNGAIKVRMYDSDSKGANRSINRAWQFNLKQGDEVKLKKSDGALEGSGHGLYFIGILM